MPYLKYFPGAKPEHEIHEIFNDDPNENFRCRVCQSTWQRRPNHGKCAGIPVFDDWEGVPDGLVSKTAIYRDYKRRLPEDVLPVAAVRTHGGNIFIELYAVEQGNPDYEGRRASTPLPHAPERKNQMTLDPFGWLPKPEKSDDQ